MKYNIIVKDNSILESYNIKFTDEELLNEEWKQLNTIDKKYYDYLSDKEKKLYNNNAQNYYVSNLGRVAELKNKDNNELVLKKCFDDGHGYACIALFKGATYRRHYTIHRLIALLFINNDDIQYNKFINHINNNCYDNRVNNLQWNYTYKSNNGANIIKGKRKQLYFINHNNQMNIDIYSYNENINEVYGIKFSEEELNNEKWKSLSNVPLKYKNIFEKVSKRDLLLYENKYNNYVSNLGRIAKLENNMLILSNVRNDKDGYKVVTLYNDNYWVHRLVGLLFIDNNNYENEYLINHKDWCKYNNRVSNLEWCDQKYNNNYRENKIKK